MVVVGRRQLVAQPGGLTLGFALHLVVDINYMYTLFVLALWCSLLF